VGDTQAVVIRHFRHLDDNFYLPDYCHMHYVYLLQSVPNPALRYTGLTDNLKARFRAHNAGQNESTKTARPWLLVGYIAMADPRRAVALERYLKSGSGKTFAKRHLH
jgi:predicted GIY-YIG superfamily endonuclease